MSQLLIGFRLPLAGFLILLSAPVAADVLDLVARQNAVAPRLHCASGEPAREVTLGRSLVENRLQAGQLHAAYAEVLALPAADADAALLRADVLRRLGRAEAQAWYRALLKTCRAAQAHHGLGQISAGSGDWPTAIREFQQAVALAPTNVRFRNDLGYALMRVGQDGLAAFEYQVARELDGDDRLVAFNQLLLHMLTANMAAAEQLIVRLQPARKDFDALLADCARLMTERSGQDAICPLRF